MKMNKLFRVSLMLLTLSVCCQSFAASTALDRFLIHTQSLKGHFMQHVMGSNVSNGQNESSGYFIFSRPGKFVWVYEHPYEQKMVSDGQHLFFYDVDLNQVTIKNVARVLPSSPAAILFGGDDLNAHFVIKPMGTRQGVEWFEATPKEHESGFDRVEIGMQNDLPVSMILVDSLGGKTQLVMKSDMRNGAIPVDTFAFKAPQGADVVQE